VSSLEGAGVASDRRKDGDALSLSLLSLLLISFSCVRLVSDEPSVSYDVTQQEFGTDEVSDEEAERYVEESLELLKLLLKNRDMTLNEVKLILAIEDPRAQEARRVYGIEDESGVSREEIAECLMDVSERRSIGNRIALRELWRELGNWPGLLEEEESVAATTPRDESAQEFQAPVGGELAKPAANPKVGRGLEDDLSGGAQTSLTDLLPDWMGYGVLYSFSIVPIIITVVAIAILWVNSFSG